MKKLLFIFLLLPLLGFTQINVNKVCDYTLAEAKLYASEIINNSPKPYRLLTTNIDETRIEFIYVPQDLTTEQIKQKRLDFHAANSISVEFEKYLKGKNDDLEIPGTETYKLARIYGKFLNVFPFWQKYYVPAATLANYKEYEMRHYKNNGLLLKFEDDEDGFWYINKFYCP